MVRISGGGFFFFRSFLVYQESYGNLKYFNKNSFPPIIDHILNNSEDDTKSLFLIIKVQMLLTQLHGY